MLAGRTNAPPLFAAEICAASKTRPTSSYAWTRRQRTRTVGQKHDEDTTGDDDEDDSHLPFDRASGPLTQKQINQREAKYKAGLVELEQIMSSSDSRDVRWRASDDRNDLIRRYTEWKSDIVLLEPLTPEDEKLKSAFAYIRAGAAKALQDPTQKAAHCISDESIEELETLPQSDGTLFQLRPHQRDGIGQSENLEGDYKAWILGDEPGLGKTAQIVGLIARSKPGTLIVCPKPLLTMWKAECGRLASRKTVVYCGSDRHHKLSLKELRMAHVVLTTYEIVQQEFTEKETVEKDWEMVRRGQTTKTIKNKAKRSKGGKGRAQDDIVVDLRRTRAKGKVFAVDWHRVILEGAHRIKTAQTVISRACTRLAERAKFKGCITGTPFQNDYSDFYSMLRFMHLEPFNDETLFKRCS